jgi:hypothetical protein
MKACFLQRHNIVNKKHTERGVDSTTPGSSRLQSPTPPLLNTAGTNTAYIYYIIEIPHRERHGNAASLRRLKNGLLIVFPVSTLLGNLRGLTPIFYKPIHPVSVTTPVIFLFLPCDHCDSRSPCDICLIFLVLKFLQTHPPSFSDYSCCSSVSAM